jgi:hypothetical protein
MFWIGLAIAIIGIIIMCSQLRPFAKLDKNDLAQSWTNKDLGDLLSAGIVFLVGNIFIAVGVLIMCFVIETI